MRLIEPNRYVQLKASGRLPSPKGLALAIIRLLQSDDYKIEDLVRLIQSDPAISGELIKFANAASYGHPRPVASLSKAISTLGTNRVRVLVIAFSVLNNHRGGKCPEFDYERFWAHALATALSARELAPFAKINPDENFTAGLLSSLGKLSLASIFPDSYGLLIDKSEGNMTHLIALEQEAFGSDHRELNATLLLEWGFPELLVKAIYYAEVPEESGFLDGSRIYGITISLHIALTMAKICVSDDGARWAMLPNLYTKAAMLGISREEMNLIADNITSSWYEWGKMLNIQTREITSLAELLATSQPREKLSATSCEWPSKKSILLISKASREATQITSHLNSNGYNVKYASNSKDGLTLAFEFKPALIIIAMHETGIECAQFCKALRSSALGQPFFVIVIVNRADDGILSHVLNIGADDLLVTPVTSFSLQEKLRSTFKIIQLQNDLIKERNGLVDSAGEWAGANRRLTLVAMTDPLTQLANRRHGMDFLSAEWAFAKTNNLPLSCLMIDVDHFKHINDHYGHHVGDSILIMVATLMRSGARSSDLLFRYGGEEFCMLCPGVDLEMACSIAERIRQDVERQPLTQVNINIYITVSIGVSIMQPKHENEEALLQEADTAMYCAKSAGRNRIVSSLNMHKYNSIQFNHTDGILKIDRLSKG